MDQELHSAHEASNSPLPPVTSSHNTGVFEIVPLGTSDYPPENEAPQAVSQSSYDNPDSVDSSSLHDGTITVKSEPSIEIDRGEMATDNGMIPLHQFKIEPLPSYSEYHGAREEEAEEEYEEAEEREEEEEMTTSESEEKSDSDDDDEYTPTRRTSKRQQQLRKRRKLETKSKSPVTKGRGPTFKKPVLKPVDRKEEIDIQAAVRGALSGMSMDFVNAGITEIPKTVLSVDSKVVNIQNTTRKQKRRKRRPTLAECTKVEDPVTDAKISGHGPNEFVTWRKPNITKRSAGLEHLIAYTCEVGD